MKIKNKLFELEIKPLTKTDLTIILFVATVLAIAFSAYVYLPK